LPWEVPADAAHAPRGATLLPMAAETSQTLDRGLRVLAMLADSPHGLTVTEIAGAVAVNRTVVYRLVTTLEQHNLARRDGAGRVHVGLGVLALSRGLQPVLREAAGPVLRSLAEELGATAHLTLADGGEALAIAVVEPTWTDFHVAYRVGARHALDQGAAGRAILLGRELLARAAAAGPAWPAGAAGATDGHAADGHAADRGGWLGDVVGGGPGGAERFVQSAGELQPGARGLAAPVLGVDGLEASVGIVTLGDLDAGTAGPRVAAAAAEVARRLS
jgi:DNA-binding IclR family transcriptional regulator